MSDLGWCVWFGAGRRAQGLECEGGKGSEVGQDICTGRRAQSTEFGYL